MNFKRLELYGFKSFADKTVVEFEDGFTGIVGPNGNGKSNLFDAIKWVLGEQSAKTLRGKNMQDVIFAGTQHRTQMSYCEVSLVFDNTGHKVFKNLNFDEVIISRKLYRSGQSEYLLNNVTCRLKDIKDAVRDTGLGRDGYSMIGQGKVDEIMNSKPEDRRSIFEEAAGISKYKQRKVESENKLKATRDHIERIDDIIKEIERRLGPLEKQAENAKKYQQLYDQMRILEVNHYLYACDNKDALLEKINNILKGINEEIAQLERDIQCCNADYEEANYSLRRADDELGAKNEERTQILLSNQKKIGHGETMAERLAGQKKELANLEENIAKYKNTIEEGEILLLKLESELKCLNENKISLENDYAQADHRFQQLVGEILDKQKAFDDSENEMLATIEKLSNVQVDITKMSAEIGFLKDRKVELEDAISATKANIEREESAKVSVEQVVNSLRREYNSTYGSLKQDKLRLNELNEEQRRLTAEQIELKKSITSSESKLEMLQEGKNHYYSYQIPVRSIMNYAKKDAVLDNKILGVVAELINVPAKYETAIEVALGGALQNIVTPTIDDVSYCINILKRERMGIVTFLPVNSMRERNLRPEHRSVLHEMGCLGVANELIGYNKAYYSVFSNLLGATVICDTYENALRISKKYNRAFKIVTLEGDVLSTQGSVTGGSRKSESRGLLSQEREIVDLEKYLQANNEKYDTNERRLDDLTIEISSLQESVTKLDAELRDREVEINSKSNELNMISDKLDEYIEKLSEYGNKYTRLCDNLDSLADRLSGSDRLESDIKTSRVSLYDEKHKSKEMLSSKSVERDQVQAQLTELRIAIKEIDSNIDKLQNDIAAEKSRIAEYKQYLLDDTSAHATISCNIAETQKQIEGAELSAEDKARLTEIETTIERLQTIKAECSKKMDIILNKKTEYTGLLQTANEKRLKEEGNIDKANTQMEVLTQRMQEEYSLDQISAEKYRVPDFDDEGVVKQISNYRRALTNLGAINFTAIEEYAEESERHSTFTAQRDDLTKAEEDLLGIIADLSREMTEIFDYEFGKISRNFEITFKEISGGGSGKLVVVDQEAEDPLNAGIDIVVAMPGKNKVSISLLSGGEKALTAVAILFAILMSKPMPFCVLDEVEAALDDSNVSIFAKYLKKFISNTQFIVITHRKPTMEQADRLYGVTMEERGVSKVVSVKLDDAVKTIGK